MEIRFADKTLERLYTEPRFDAGFEPGVVKVFRKRIQFILAAPNERDFYKMKSLRFEKLKGDRSHQYSMRVNDQWRLILEFEGEPPNKIVIVVGIEDYH